MTNDNDFLDITASAENTTDYIPLEDGCYPAVCVAIVGKKLPKYQSNELEDKIIFTFQIVEDGQIHYVSTNPMKKILNDRSNLFTLLHDWTKKGLEDFQSYNMGELLGKPCQLTVRQESKGEKVYLRISGILPIKASQKVSVVEDAAPYFLTKGAFFSKLAEGITIKDVPATSTAPAQETVQPAKPKTTKVDAKEFLGDGAPSDDNDDECPF